MTRRLLVLGMVGVLAAVGLLVGRGAEATSPGENGRITFSLDTGSGFQVHTIRPDGTGPSANRVRGAPLREPRQVPAAGLDDGPSRPQPAAGDAVPGLL